MLYFFTRRRQKRGTDKFSDKFGSVTRYIEVRNTSSTGFSGVQLSAEKWARRVLAQSTNGQVLIYVHGFNTSQIDLVKRLEKLRAKLRFNGAVIAFDWPTRSSSSPFDLLKIYRSAKTNVNKLDNILVTEGMNVLWTENTGINFHVFGHSMGAYAIARAFSLPESDPGPVGKNWKVKEAVFGAADIDARMMRKDGSAALTMHIRSKRLTHFHSTVDDVLQMSGQIHAGHPRSGRAGLAPDVAPEMFDVSVQDRYLAKFQSHQQNTQRSHSWYLDDDGFLADLDETLRGVKAANTSTREPHVGGDQRLIP